MGFSQMALNWSGLLGRRFRALAVGSGETAECDFTTPGSDT